MVKHTVKATRTQVREFLSFWELTRQISRWFLFVGFLFRGIVLYGSWQNFAKVKPPSFVQIFSFPSSLSQKHIRQPRPPRQVVFSCSILLLFNLAKSCYITGRNYILTWRMNIVPRFSVWSLNWRNIFANLSPTWRIHFANFSPT